MKKDLIFAPILSVIAASLFLLKFTGMTAHIIISAVGAIVLIAYTVLTKKEWKLPHLEIITRAFYGVALITGVIIMNVHTVMALNIIHKVCAVLFLAAIIVLLLSKSTAKKQ